MEGTSLVFVLFCRGHANIANTISLLRSLSSFYPPHFPPPPAPIRKGERMAGVAAAYLGEAPNLAVCVECMFEVYTDGRHIGSWDEDTRQYNYITYAETYEQVKSLSVAFRDAPLNLPTRSSVGIMCANRVEWMAVDFTCAMNDHMVVGLHPSWDDARIAYIAEETEISIVFCDDLEKLRSLKSITKCEKFVYINDDVDADVPEWAFRYTDLLKADAAGFVPPSEQYASDCANDNEDEVFTVMYSSGTTGAAKGVATPKATWRKTNCNPGPLGSISAIADRRTVSYMSLCHGADRGVCWFTSMSGGCVSFVTAEENSDAFYEQLRCAQPTFYLAMACSWQDIYAQYQKILIKRLNESLRACHFKDIFIERLVGSVGGLEYFETHHKERLSAIQAMYLETRVGYALVEEVSSLFREKLGGALLIAVTGGGPTPSDVYCFIARCLSEGNECRAIDSYGSTEFPGISSNGEVSSEIEIKLRRLDTAEPLAHAKHAHTGEILVRRKDGKKTGYYKNDRLTQECWDEDGWYHTGDVGCLSTEPPLHAILNGLKPKVGQEAKKYLKIVDRVKNLEEVYYDGDSVWIEPGRLESLFSAENGEHDVLHSVVVCDRNREGVSLVLHVAADADKSDMFYLKLMKRIAKQARMKPYEIPIGLAVCRDEWSVQNGLVTISGKINRRLVKERYFGSIKFAEELSDVAPVQQEEKEDGAPKVQGEKANGSSSSCSSSSSKKAYLTPQQFLDSMAECLRFERVRTPHSLAQIHASFKSNMPLPKHKKGSRKVFLETTNDKGEVRTIDTAQGKDWLVGPEALVFGKVSDLDVDEFEHKSGEVVGRDVSANFMTFPSFHQSPKKSPKHMEQVCSPLSADEDIMFAPSEDSDSSEGCMLTKLDSIGYNELLSESVPKTPALSTNATLEVIIEERALDSNVISEIDGAPLPQRAQEEHAQPSTSPVVEVLSSTRTALYIQVNVFEPLRVTMDRVASTIGAPLCSLKFGQLLLKGGDNVCGVLPVGASQGPHDAAIGTLLASRDHSILSNVSPYYALAPSAADKLNAQFQNIVRRAMVIREQNTAWNLQRMTCMKAFQADVDAELAALQVAVRDMSAPLSNGTRVQKDECIVAICRCLMEGKKRIIKKSIKRAETRLCPEAEEAWKNLDEELVKLRVLGDELDVDTRALPVTWRLNVDWIVAASSKETVQCMFGCGKPVYMEELEKHSNGYEGPCQQDIGVASEEDQAMSTTLGGDQSIVCELTGHLIDAEAVELGEGDSVASFANFDPSNMCAARETERFHSLDSSLDRHPEFHALLESMWAHFRASLAAGDSPALQRTQRRLLLVSKHQDEAWVQDKQHIFWLHKFVCAGRDIGEYDTPASLLTRACSAFEKRHCLGVSRRDIRRPRSSHPFALPKAAGIAPIHSKNFDWITYAGLWRLVSPVALQLQRLLPQGSTVLVAGYNDIEWVVVDFACALSGMTSVGLHTTIPKGAALSLCDASDAVCLFAMANLWKLPSGEEKCERWCVPDLREHCTDLLVVAMDASPEEVSDTRPVLSMQAWVADTPPPTESLGKVFKTGGKLWEGCLPEKQALTSLLPTSGTSGTPKLVAVSGKSFCADISGDNEERAAISKSLTISYIPLSHSSDRYKLWQHVTMGGRVALCFYAAHHWSAHETSKKSQMISYTSPVKELFNQVSDVNPTSMACPPNIWSGLYEAYSAQYSPLEEDSGSGSESPHSVASLGGRVPMGPDSRYMKSFCKSVFGENIQTLATGGSPTPKYVSFPLLSPIPLITDISLRLPLRWGAPSARRSWIRTVPLNAVWKWCMRGLSFRTPGLLSPSPYPPTTGAITSNQTTEGSKFEEVKILLLNRPDLGLCREGSLAHSTGEEHHPHVRGEVCTILQHLAPFLSPTHHPPPQIAVQSPSVAVGYYGNKEEQDKGFVIVGKNGSFVHPAVPGAVQPVAAPGVWYLTGDVAEYHPNTGRYVLIDRVNAIVSTKAGCIVVAGLVENLVEADAGVRQCLAFASPEHAAVFILVVPQSARAPENSDGHLPVAIVRTDSHSEAPPFFDDPATYMLLRKKHLRKVQKVIFGITSGNWAAANGLLNGELKKRRGEIKQRYATILHKAMLRADAE